MHGCVYPHSQYSNSMDPVYFWPVLKTCLKLSYKSVQDGYFGHDLNDCYPVYWPIMKKSFCLCNSPLFIRHISFCIECEISLLSLAESCDIYVICLEAYVHKIRKEGLKGTHPCHPESVYSKSDLNVSDQFQQFFSLNTLLVLQFCLQSVSTFHSPCC